MVVEAPVMSWVPVISKEVTPLGSQLATVVSGIPGVESGTDLLAEASHWAHLAASKASLF